MKITRETKIGDLIKPNYKIKGFSYNSTIEGEITRINIDVEKIKNKEKLLIYDNNYITNLHLINQIKKNLPKEFIKMLTDITKCTGTNCPLKADCLRFVIKANSEYQSYFLDIPFENNDCEYYINIK